MSVSAESELTEEACAILSLQCQFFFFSDRQRRRKQQEMEDELGDTIMICGDFSARSSLWDQHGTNQQGCALEAALSDVLFTPLSTASPTHPGTRQDDTESTIDLALVSPKLVPWTCAETSHHTGVNASL